MVRRPVRTPSIRATRPKMCEEAFQSTQAFFTRDSATIRYLVESLSRVKSSVEHGGCLDVETAPKT